jgi:DNA-nicking Smr family endonuclease
VARRTSGRRAAGDDGDDDEDPPLEVDLHGLRPKDALAAVLRAVHQARVQRRDSLRVVTGRGASNGTGAAVLRTQVEEWTRSADARARGVVGFERTSKGGALVLTLAKS